MKILFCHNFYQQAGGEDIAVANEMAMLKQHGHEVEMFSVSNNVIKTFWHKLLVSFHLTYSNKYKSKLKNVIADFNPDIVHVHNFFPLLTPSIFDACVEMNVPAVHTLHNYRLICPSATLFVNGSCNEESIEKTAYAMVKYKAYQNSFIGTFLLARAIEKYKKNQLWLKKVDKFIAPSQSVKNTYIKAGFLSEKITVKPNFIQPKPIIPISLQQDREQDKTTNEEYAIFLGRLVEEKGIRMLLNSWRETDPELRIYGRGPLEQLCKDAQRSNIRYYGEVTREEALQALKQAKFLVMPTQWHEPFGLVVIEALSLGVPVIVSRMGALPEIISHGYNGLIFEYDDIGDFYRQIDQMKSYSKLTEMKKNALNSFNKQYTASMNYPLLIDIYNKCLLERKNLGN